MEALLAPYKQRHPVMLHRYQTGSAVVGLAADLRILIEPLEFGHPIVVTDPDHLYLALTSCELAREKALQDTTIGVSRAGAAWGGTA